LGDGLQFEAARCHLAILGLEQTLFGIRRQRLLPLQIEPCDAEMAVESRVGLKFESHLGLFTGFRLQQRPAALIR